jgi:hypothetical protein
VRGAETGAPEQALRGPAPVRPGSAAGPWSAEQGLYRRGRAQLNMPQGQLGQVTVQLSRACIQPAILSGWEEIGPGVQAGEHGDEVGGGRDALQR